MRSFDSLVAIESLLRISNAPARDIGAQEAAGLQEILATIGVIELNIYGVCFFVDFH